jgi:AraC-like DNA-binding protein
MLFAQGEVSRGRASMRSHVGLGRDVQIFLVRRSGVCFDTEFLPARSSRGRPEMVVWYVRRGEVHWSGGEASSDSPRIWLFSGAVIDGEGGTRPRNCHACGDPFESIMLRVRVEKLQPDLVRSIVPSETVQAAADRYFSLLGTETSDASATEIARSLMHALEADGVIDRGTESAAFDAAGVLRPVWSAVQSSFRSLGATASLKVMAAVAGQSVRQTERLIWAAHHGLMTATEGWRDTMLTYRIRLAIVLLSSPEASISDVARVVGYSRQEAMSNAFRRAGLPAPQTIRREVLAHHAAIFGGPVRD